MAYNRQLFSSITNATVAKEFSAFVAEVRKSMEQVRKNKEKLKEVLPTKRIRLSDQGMLAVSTGHVEVWHEGEWGTVCDDGLIGGNTRDQSLDTISDNGRNVAQVICQSLGYAEGTPTLTTESLRGSGTIWMDDVNCDGNEPSLFDCTYKWSYDSNNCMHKEDFSVTCST